MEIEAQYIERSNRDRWAMDPARYETVPERGVCRLVKYKKTFAEDVLVKKDGAPLIMKASGKPLRACDVMRERADLALDKDGNLLSQGDFTSRYIEWLEAFTYPEGTNLADEPIPAVERYVSEIQDSFSESTGYVEMYFDPKLDQEWTPLEKYDTDGREAAEREADAKSDITKLLMGALVDKLNPDQVAELLGDSVGKEIPIVDANSGAQQAKPARKPLEPMLAPCGKMCKGAAGLAAHKRKCANEACGGVSDNTDRGGEAA